MGFQSGSNSKNIINLKKDDIDKISQSIIKSLGPLIGSGGKTVIIQGNGKEVVQEDLSPISMEKLAKAMISQSSDKKTNFEKLGVTKEIKKDAEETRKTLDILKGLE